MSERKSKHVNTHISEVWKIIFATLAVVAITCAYAKDWAHEEADNFIEQYYSSMNTTNTTTLLDIQYLEPIYNETEPVQYAVEEVEEIPVPVHFNPHTGNLTVVHRNSTEHHNIRGGSNDRYGVHHNFSNDIRGGPNEHKGHHHEHHNSSVEPVRPAEVPAPIESSQYVDPGM
jgi:hypothetical protein